MKNLKKELQKFWNWAQISPEEYLLGIRPRNPDMYRRPEWETEYPQFQMLEDAFINDISVKENFYDNEFVNLVVLAITVDNESEMLASIAAEKLDSEDFQKVLDISINKSITDSQYQLVTLIPKSSAKNKIENIMRFVNDGANEYVKDRARYVLQNYDDFVLKNI